MNITVTLIIQMLVFATLVWGVQKFIWPIITDAMDEREKRIATGLAAADKGQKSLDEANVRAEEIIRQARERANQISDHAAKRSNEMVEAAKTSAKEEGARLVEMARTEAATEVGRARDGLRREVGALAVVGASRLLEREVDAKAHTQLLDKLAEDIARG